MSEQLARLDGRTALVTGASRGIGRAIAIALAGAGATVHCVARSRAALEETAAVIGDRGHIWCADVADADAVDAMLTSVAAIAPVDLLVNNAGRFPLSPVTATAPRTFEETLQANLIGPFRLVHALLPAMQLRGQGDIVTIGSVADRQIFGGNGAYSASKFGARALHAVLREELRGTGVRATLVSPAATDTPIWDPIDPDHTPGFTPRAAMLRPEDVADAVLWAVSRPAHVNIDELRLSRS